MGDKAKVRISESGSARGPDQKEGVTWIRLGAKGRKSVKRGPGVRNSDRCSGKQGGGGAKKNNHQVINVEAQERRTRRKSRAQLEKKTRLLQSTRIKENPNSYLHVGKKCFVTFMLKSKNGKNKKKKKNEKSKPACRQPKKGK